jgi:hypothetical protein
MLAAIVAGLVCGLALSSPLAALLHSAALWPTPNTAAFLDARSAAPMFDAAPGSPHSQQTVNPPWSEAENVSSSTGRAANPVVVAGADDAVHLLWEQNGRVYHALRRADQWTAPLAIATGQRPSAGVTADGALHVVFSNEFAGRYNVFYVVFVNNVWSLPRLVSKTPGMSTFPALAVDQAGVVHAAWADTSPGFSVIYHGWLQGAWLNESLRNARGTAPALTLDSATGGLHLAYQASGINNGLREIYHLQGRTYEWSLPENISISPAQESLGVTMAGAPDGSMHLAWQEHVGDKAHIRYVSGRGAAWSAPLPVTDLAVDAREPRLVITQGRQLSLVWREANAIVYQRRELPAGEWLPPKPLVVNPGGLEGLALAGAPAGDLHLAWCGWSESSERAVFYSQHGPLMRPKVFLPGVSVGAR